MESSFYERVIKPSEDAEQYVKDIGGLPEITASAETLFDVLDQTRKEIEEAEFAPSRFPTQATPSQIELINGPGSASLSPLYRRAIEDGGLAGAKRFELETRLVDIQSHLSRTLWHLTHLRAEIKVSKTEFDAE